MRSSLRRVPTCFSIRAKRLTLLATRLASRVAGGEEMAKSYRLSDSRVAEATTWMMEASSTMIRGRRPTRYMVGGVQARASCRQRRWGSSGVGAQVEWAGSRMATRQALGAGGRQHEARGGTPGLGSDVRRKHRDSRRCEGRLFNAPDCGQRSVTCAAVT